ncbi:hypothetical protein [Candidatus Pantoea persica]|uniref:hypothetical protein n=1 Tax=Candidatus Pantoea persica TaxID=2518128 RepID=UPI0035A8B58F
MEQQYARAGRAPGAEQGVCARQALADYQQVLTRDADNSDAVLSRVEALVALQRHKEVRQASQALPAAQAGDSVNLGRRVALAWQAVGDASQAAALFAGLKQRAASLPPSKDKALVFRNAARLERAQQQPEVALADYRQAMAASGIGDGENVSRLTRNNAQDDWLKSSIRSDTADLYRQQDTTLMLEQDYSRNKGTGGVSDFTAHTTHAAGGDAAGRRARLLAARSCAGLGRHLRDQQRQLR